MLNTDTKAREFKFDSIHYIKALFELMKPRVMSLAIFTCVVGFLITPFKSINTKEHFNTRFVHKYLPVDSVKNLNGTDGQSLEHNGNTQCLTKVQ